MIKVVKILDSDTLTQKINGLRINGDVIESVRRSVENLKRPHFITYFFEGKAEKKKKIKPTSEVVKKKNKIQKEKNKIA